MVNNDFNRLTPAERAKERRAVERMDAYEKEQRALGRVPSERWYAIRAFHAQFI